MGPLVLLFSGITESRTVKRETAPIALRIQGHQKRDQHWGRFFLAWYMFTERTMKKFFYEDMDMPIPILRMWTIPGEHKAEYAPMDGMILPSVITFDPIKFDDAADLCEAIAHELVHAWQVHLKYELTGNKHNQEFHDKMKDYGIVTQNDDGQHRGYIGDVWQDWVRSNDDLYLDNYIIGLPEDHQ